MRVGTRPTVSDVTDVEPMGHKANGTCVIVEGMGEGAIKLMDNTLVSVRSLIHFQFVKKMTVQCRKLITDFRVSLFLLQLVNFSNALL